MGTGTALRVSLRVLALVLVIGGLLLAIAWLGGMFEEQVDDAASAPPPTRRLGAAQATTEVHEVRKAWVEELVGTLRGARRTEVSPRVLAEIKEVLVDAGSAVTRGQVLVNLNDRDLRARVAQAADAVEAARSRREHAESVFRRDEGLLQTRSISQAEFDATRSRLEVARAEERRATQALEEARAQLAWTEIAAPKDGIVVERLAEPGDMAVPGQPLLTMYDPTSLRLEVPVPERLAVRLSPGDRIPLRIDALEREFEGVVDQRVPQAEAQSRSFLVKVRIEDTSGLFEGMFGRLLVPAGVRRHLCLELAAVKRIGQLTFVDVVREDGGLSRRLVTLGREGIEGRAEVLSGLRVGERIALP